MKVFVARQPILDRENKIIAYELLYRNDYLFNAYDHTNGDQATADVIINTFFNIGSNHATNDRKCFINFTENLLKLRIPTYFPKEKIVIEILEDVNPTGEVLQVCQELKNEGYTIALDDFKLDGINHQAAKFLPYTDIIKVDFQSTSVEERKEIIRESKKRNIEILAEKIETFEEYLIALKEGFNYFQGYYFSKPIILSTYDIPENFQTYFLILNELKLPNPNIQKLSSIIEADLSLSYKLLKMINSPLYGTINKVKSIQQAIVLLGLKEIEKWIFVLTIRETKEKSHIHQDLIYLSLIRAKFCELFASKFGQEENKSSYFITGLFSLIDALLHRPMEKILEGLPLEDEIKLALLDYDNEYKRPLKMIKQIERAEWTELSTGNTDIKKLEEVLSTIYVEAIQWTNQYLQSVG